MTVTSLPYLLGYSVQGEGERFTGFVFGVEDGNSYIAKMLSGSAGAWTFRTPYTSINQRGAPVFLPYLLLGKLAKPSGLHEQLVVIYHLFRIAAGFLAILASYDFLALFLIEIRLRRVGIALVALGGGLGWLAVLTARSGSLPLEFYSPESFGFLALYGLPHLALSRALFLWGFVFYLKAIRNLGAKDVLRSGSIAGICWFLASLAQPLAGPIAGMVCVAHLLALAGRLAWRRRQESQSGWPEWSRMALLVTWAGLLAALPAIANLWIARQDPFLQSWMAQNKILSPLPQYYLLAYGLLLPFAAYGGARLIKREPWKGWFLVAWLLSLPILAYAPINLQRRLVEGVWVAVVALSLAAIELRTESAVFGESERTSRRWKVSFFTFAAILTFPSTALLLAGGFLAAIQSVQPAFRPADEVAVFEYLGRQGVPGANVLTAYATGNALPAWAPARVVIGHGPESAGLEDLLPRVRDFYASSTPDSERLELLRETDSNYVFWGPAERALGPWDPAIAPYLDEIYRQGEYSLFEFIYEEETLLK